MKEKFIVKIQCEMEKILSTKQLKDLANVLTVSLMSFEMVEAIGETQMDNNEALLSKFLSAKRLEGCSEKSLKYYEMTITNFIVKVDIAIPIITTDDLRGYLSDYQTIRKSSKVTIDNMRRIFSSFFSWLEDEDYILKSPVRRIRKIKADKVIKETFTDEGLELLRDSCTEIRDLAMIDLLSSTGMRVGELVGLNITDINLYERECVVFGKGARERLVYFDARSKIHLKEYLDSRDDDCSALFVSFAKPHNRLLVGGVEARLRQIGKRANIQKVHPHKFRRTLATKAIDKGMPIEQVQHLLGHVKIDTTMHYAMVNQANVKNSHRKLMG